MEVVAKQLAYHLLFSFRCMFFLFFVFGLYITPHINLLIVHPQEVALEEGQCFLRYFGVQFYGECWSDHEAETRYPMHGVADKEQNCIEGWCQNLVSLLD